MLKIICKNCNFREEIDNVENGHQIILHQHCIYMKISELFKCCISVLKMTFSLYLYGSDSITLTTPQWCNAQYFNCMTLHRTYTRKLNSSLKVDITSDLLECTKQTKYFIEAVNMNNGFADMKCILSSNLSKENKWYN